VQIRPADSDRFLANPDPAVRVVLVYGGDEGLVAERTATFVNAVVGDSDDPFSHIRLDGSAVADDPGLLADEAHAIPMFGGRRAISIRLVGNASFVPALELILATPPVDAWIVISAGDLRKTAPVRRLCETHKGAAAVACYADTGRDLDRLIDEETRAAGLVIAADARAALRNLIGGDRLASRSEIQKLCLYAAGAKEISVEDVGAVIGDASAFAIDEAIDALAVGNTPAFARLYVRLVGSGTPGSVVAGAAIRHFNFLHRARAAFDEGKSADAIVASALPPIFFKRRDDVIRQIALWSAPRIERALAGLDQAMLDSRRRNALSDEVIAQALMMIAAAAGSRRAVSRQS
jgi:DNA polymerase-3 subunit delta